MKKTSQTVKVLQAVGVYSFALVAAAACAPGFTPKKFGTETNVTTGGKPGDGTETSVAAFEPTGFVVKKAPGVITMIFRDGDQDVTMELKHEGAAKQIEASAVVGETTYSLIGVCEDSTTSSATGTNPNQDAVAPVSATTDRNLEDFSNISVVEQPSVQQPMDDTRAEAIREHRESLEQNGQVMIEQGVTTTESCANLGILLKKEGMQHSAAAFTTQGDSMVLVNVLHSTEITSPIVALQTILGSKQAAN